MSGTNGHLNGFSTNGHAAPYSWDAMPDVEPTPAVSLQDAVRPWISEAWQRGQMRGYQAAVKDFGRGVIVKGEPRPAKNPAHTALMLALVDAEIAAKEGDTAAPERLRALTSLIGETRKLATAIGQESAGEEITVKGFNASEKRDDHGRWSAGSAKEFAGLNLTPEFHAAVIPALEKTFGELSPSLTLDKDRLAELVDESHSPAAVWAEIEAMGTDTNSAMEPSDIWRAARVEQLHGKLMATAERKASRAGEDWEDGTSAWIASAFRNLAQSQKPQIMAVLGRHGPATVKSQWKEDLHPRDDHGRFVSRDAIAHARDAGSDSAAADKLRERVTDPKEREKLDNALNGSHDLGRTKHGQKRHEAGLRANTKQTARHAVRELRLKAARERLSVEDLQTLTEHLPHLTIEDLRATRNMLGASFHGDRRKEQMLKRLNAWAEGEAGKLRGEKDATPETVETVPTGSTLETIPESPGLVRHPVDVDKSSIFANGRKRSQYPTMHQSISMDALKGANAVWHHQGDPQQTLFNAAQDGASKYTQRAAAEIKAAHDAGYRFTNHRAGKYGTLWVMEKDGKVLTERGAQALVNGTGKVDFVTQAGRETAKPVIDALHSFVSKLPESTQNNFGALVTAINRSPLGSHVQLSRTEGGDIRLSDKNGTWHVYEPAAGHDANGTWHRQLESSLPRFLSKLEHMAQNDIGKEEGDWAIHDRAADIHAVGKDRSETSPKSSHELSTFDRMDRDLTDEDKGRLIRENERRKTDERMRDVDFVSPNAAEDEAAAQDRADRMNRWAEDKPDSEAAQSQAAMAAARLERSRATTHERSPSLERVSGGKPKDAPKAEGKEPWEMSGKEFTESRKGQRVERGGYFNRAGQIDQDHFLAVAHALQTGKSVPAEVVNEYRPRLESEGFRTKLEKDYPVSSAPSEAASSPLSAFHAAFTAADAMGRHELTQAALRGDHGDEVKDAVGGALDEHYASGRSKNATLADKHNDILRGVQPTEKSGTIPSVNSSVERQNTTESRAKPTEQFGTIRNNSEQSSSPQPSALGDWDGFHKAAGEKFDRLVSEPDKPGAKPVEATPAASVAAKTAADKKLDNEIWKDQNGIGTPSGRPTATPEQANPSPPARTSSEEIAHLEDQLKKHQDADAKDFGNRYQTSRDANMRYARRQDRNQRMREILGRIAELKRQEAAPTAPKSSPPLDDAAVAAFASQNGFIRNKYGKLVDGRYIPAGQGWWTRGPRGESLVLDHEQVRKLASKPRGVKPPADGSDPFAQSVGDKAVVPPASPPAMPSAAQETKPPADNPSPPAEKPSQSSPSSPTSWTRPSTYDDGGQGEAGDRDRDARSADAKAKLTPDEHATMRAHNIYMGDDDSFHAMHENRDLGIEQLAKRANEMRSLRRQNPQSRDDRAAPGELYGEVNHRDIKAAAKAMREESKGASAPPPKGESPAAGEKPRINRQSPAKGTPEREKLDAEHERVTAEIEAAGTAASKVKEERDNARQGTKRHEQLTAKHEKLQDKYLEMHRSGADLRKQKAAAHLEDLVEGGDEANSISAQAKLDEHNGKRSSPDTFPKIQSLAEAELRTKHGITDPQKIKSIAGDATSMIAGYPGSRPLSVQVENSLRAYNRKTEQMQMNDELTNLDIPPEHKNRYRDRLKNDEYNPERQAETIKAAKELARQISNRKAKSESHMMAALQTGPKSHEEMMEHMGKSYDEATRSNVDPFTFEESAAAAKNLMKQGHAEVFTDNKGVKRFRLKAK